MTMPGAFVIFGATGDLARRMLFPSLYFLYADGLLPPDLKIIGAARSAHSDAEFRADVKTWVKDRAAASFSEDAWKAFEKRLGYVAGDATDPQSYVTLREKLNGDTGALFYLSTSPALYIPIVQGLAEQGLTGAPNGVIVEKPIGKSYASCEQINSAIAEQFAESRTFRIDHYLGKETVQNLIALRFANALFEPLWNRHYIDHVQITVAETLGVEGRFGYYNEYGATRDMVQNHLLQLLSFIAMEPPHDMRPESVRSEKVKVLRSLRPIRDSELRDRTVRGQYARGVADGKTVPGYTEEEGGKPSDTETFVALCAHVDNWRWAGVPFYLRTGKRLARHLTQVVIRFKRTPLMLFGDKVHSEAGPNALILNIQPEDSITIMIRAKKPGPNIVVDTIPLDFDYSEFGKQSPATGYETLLHDCMIGDMTLFHREDSVDASWRIVNPILDVWGALPPRDFPDYDSGTWGPTSADKLLARDGRHWENPA